MGEGTVSEINGGGFKGVAFRYTVSSSLDAPGPAGDNGRLAGDSFHPQGGDPVMSRLSFKGAARIAAALVVLPALSGRVARAQEGPWALTNARIQTVTRGVIEHGTIVIRNGLIAAVGADVTAPAEARVLDLGGRTVSPGLIDLPPSLRLPPPPTPPPP